MAPLPKRKRSKSSVGTHRAHQHLNLPHLVECAHCHRPMRMHHVCPACGFYRGRDVLGAETDLA
jgi:large subunit ribosomal protein L32